MYFLLPNYARQIPKSVAKQGPRNAGPTASKGPELHQNMLERLCIHRKRPCILDCSHDSEHFVGLTREQLQVGSVNKPHMPLA